MLGRPPRHLFIITIGTLAAMSGTANAGIPDTLLPLARVPNLTAPIINDAGAYATGPIIEGKNTSSGFGVEGITDGVGAGVYGYAADTSGGYGVYGYSRGAGRGVSGYSGDGDGVLGTAKTAGHGVYGVSASGDGVAGTTAGASAFGGSFTNTSSSGSASAVNATANGNAIVATSNDANGILGNSGNGDPVAGVVGTTASYYEQGGNAGVWGQDLSANSCGNSCYNYGVYGTTNNNGTGVYGTSDGGTGVGAQTSTGFGIYVNVIGAGTALHLADDGTAGSLLLTANSAGGSDVLSLDNLGDLDIAGNFTQNGMPQVFSPGRGAQIEAVGDGRVVGGIGRVNLDPTFAKHLDTAAPYHVFLTPNGESEGLYVADKSATGFTVRENHHATSTLAFDYRIVGSARRLPGHRDPREASVRLPRRSR